MMNESQLKIRQVRLVDLQLVQNCLGVMQLNDLYIIIIIIHYYYPGVENKEPSQGLGSITVFNKILTEVADTTTSTDTVQSGAQLN